MSSTVTYPEAPDELSRSQALQHERELRHPSTTRGMPMPITLTALCSLISPERCTLLLGAGASVPSGAPSGPDLSNWLWKEVAKTPPQSDDLVETASILVRRLGRAAVAKGVIQRLTGLKATGGLLALPRFQWAGVYTTNFDQIVENAFKQNNLPVVPIRSNYDFSSSENVFGDRLFKLHGCISQDESTGHKGSMILTEDDYDSHKSYRQTLFANLSAAFLSGDVLVIGQSLRDRHLADLVKNTLAAKTEGAPGHVYVLVYDADDLRAPLLEDRGAKIAFGGIDDLVHKLDAKERVESIPASAGNTNLPTSLITTVIDAGAAAAHPAEVLRMFNGAPATYADIRAGATFERALTADCVQRLKEGDRSLTIIGAAGVGKTSFARQIGLALFDDNIRVWEHKRDFFFDERAWIKYERELRTAGDLAVLVMDECTNYMRAVNALANHLSTLDQPALKIVLTANAAQWAPRIKSPQLFRHGRVVELSRLNDSEVRSLLNLVEFSAAISPLVASEFKQLTRTRQFERLRQKCGADMFVCLKNIFASESLDTIILREYDELQPNFQEYYRYVAALEAVGTRVHRQLIIRMLEMNPSHVQAVLIGLSGIVDEYDISPRNGIYGWATRHLVIARKIAEYKFSGLEELQSLFETIIDSMNLAQPLELATLRAICDQEHGIGRLGDARARMALYKRLIERAPGERIPWHRYIRELLDHDLEQAEFALRNAQESVGADAPIDRYKVRLLVERAERTHGISDSDRIALLRRAYEQATRNIELHPMDKFSYNTLCDVALKLQQRGQGGYLLLEALTKMSEAAQTILDPAMLEKLQYYEGIAARLR
nr:SIR2 family protein [Nitrosomonas nitrosa]